MFFGDLYHRFLLGIGVGAEYPCGSVAASEQSEGSSVAKGAQHRWFALATNCMIDLGFVVASFVPLVLYWMFVFPITSPDRALSPNVGS
jgi:MFS family permease